MRGRSKADVSIAVVVNGEIVIRPIMVVALTYDHRLLDGREAVSVLGKPILIVL